MKTFRTLIDWLVIAACFFSTAIFGAPVTVEWSAGPGPTPDFFRIYRGIEPLRVTTSLSATVDLPSGQDSTLTVTAVNRAGESEQSESISVTVPPDPDPPAPPPAAPPAYRVLPVYSSELLEPNSWQLDGYYVTRPRPDGTWPEKKFFRMELFIPAP